MLRLKRLRFESVGHRDARFAPLELDFTGADGAPLHTILWLRNGGGKSSLLNLLFALLRPGRREFLGKEEQGKDRGLGDYVLRGDTAHVVAEWARPDAGAPPLVTGMVLEWKDRTPSADESRLARLWYGFTGGGGAGASLFDGGAPTGFDDLPILVGGRRLPLARFREQLRELAAAHPELELAITSTQTDWKAYLERQRLDTEVFRYQLLMNREEGGASRLFKQRCRTDEGFVELLLELAVAPEQPESVAGVFGKYSEELARRPLLERELRFVTGALGRLRPLAGAVAAYRESEAALANAARAAATLRAALTAAARDAEHQARVHAAAAERLQREAAEEDTRRRRTSEQRDAALLLAGRLQLARAEARAAQAMEARAQAELAACAWELVPTLRELEVVRAAIRAIEEELARAEQEARPLREERELAARALSARLAADRRASLVAAAEADAAAETADASSTAAFETLKRVAGDQAQLAQEQKSIRAQRQDFAARRREAEAAGAIAPDEAAEAAQARLLAESRDLDARRAAAAERLAALAAEEDAARRHRERAQTSLAQAERDHALVQDKLDELGRRRAELEGSPRLREVSESENPDLFAAGAELVAQLLAQADASDRRILAEELTATSDRRALAALEETGLLPPRVEVERVLARLREAEVPAVAGWRYLAENARASEQAALLAAHPELADGVVVTDPSKLERAQEILESRALHPAAAVVVATAGPLLAGCPPRELSFLVPPAPALLDHGAAEEERDARRERLSGLETRVAAHRGARDRDAALAARVRDLLADFPEERRGRLAAREAELTQAARQARERLAELEAALAGIGAQRQEVEAARATAEARARAVVAHLVRVEELVRHAQRDKADESRLLRIEATLEGLLGEEARAEAQRADAARASKLALLAAEAQRAAAGRIEAQRRELALPEPEEPAPPEPAEPLLERYKLLDARYRQEASDPELVGRMRAAEQRRAGLSTEVEDAPPQVRERAGELLATPEGADEQLRRRALDVARAARDDSVGAAAVAADAVRRARDTVAGRELRGTAAELPAPLPETPEEAEALAVRFREEMTAASNRTTELQKAEARERQKVAERERAEQILDGQAATLSSALAHTDVEAVEEGAPFPGDLDAAKAAATEAREGLEARVSEERAAGKARDELLAALRVFVGDPDFDALRGPLRERLLRDADGELLGRAEELAADLEMREGAIRGILEELVHHRDLLAREIYQQVLEALRVLSRAERASALPDGFRDWSGQRFLHIAWRKPGKDEEVLARLAHLIDVLVERGDRPGGMSLLYKAVNTAVGPEGFRVSILKPTPSLRAERVSVTDLPTFSGGEQLTAAVLLYATLALMRGETMGFRRTGGLLLLDNPVGKSSNVTFLDLQMRVADAAGLQLLYTTAVDDRDAIAAFPHWIRLRNERVDRRTGNQHVELDGLEDGHSRLAAARIWKRQATAGGDAGNGDPA